MQFYQKYTYNEYQFGQQTVMFAVSDNYSEIFQNTGIETDIFILDTLKQDLNLSEAKFAVDELGFGINQAACRNDNDKNALAFTLECKDKFRVCAVFFLRENEVPSNDNLLFLGAIDNKVSGDDLFWDSVPFGTLINPIREYKFSVLSLDISLLDRCKFSGDNYNENSVRVNNIYERIRVNNDAAINALNEPNLFSYVADGGNFGADINYYVTLAKLSKVIELYLSQASEMILDLLGIDIEFILEESNFGLQVSPIQYTLSSNKAVIYEQYVYNNSFYNIGMNKEHPGNETSMYREPYIDLRMVHANFMRNIGDWNDRDESVGTISERGMNARAMYNTERSFSFQSLGNVSELLFEIAKSFACYLTSSYSISEDGKLLINMRFVPRLALTDTTMTYIVGASDASFDTAIAISDNENKYYAQANDTASDGTSTVKVESKGGSITWYTSDELKFANSQRANDKEQNNTEYKRLVLSTSQTIIDSGNGVLTPINAFAQINQDRIFLTTALFINTQILEAEQRELISQFGLNFTSYCRPIGKIYTKIDGKAVEDNNGDGVQLADYVNRTLGHEKSYYETEYSLTIPFWNGFSKNSLGTNCSWNNLRLGSIIELNEDIRVNINGEWQRFRPAIGTQFVVVGKEISLSTPETKLTLQNIGRFAYSSYYEGKEGELLAPTKSLLWAKPTNTEDLSMYSSIEIADGEIVLIGDAIMINPETQKAFKAVAQKEYYGKVIGIAKLIRNNICYYQYPGIIEDSKYNFDTDKLIFVRTAPDSNSLNISQSYLNVKTETEDLIIRLGYPISSNSFQCQLEYSIKG